MRTLQRLVATAGEYYASMEGVKDGCQEINVGQTEWRIEAGREEEKGNVFRSQEIGSGEDVKEAGIRHKEDRPGCEAQDHQEDPNQTCRRSKTCPSAETAGE
jgi:hypothetical protein